MILRRLDHRPATFRRWDGLTDHTTLLEAMRLHAERMIAGDRREEVWLVQCPAGLSAGSSARAADIAGTRLVEREDRGGRRAGTYSYHGPGVRIVIVLLDLRQRRKDMRAFGLAIDEWLRSTVGGLGVKADAPGDHPGVWVNGELLAALGFRINQWVTSYGMAINVNPELADLAGLKPCGLDGRGFTSLAALGLKATMADVDAALRKAFTPIFGPTSMEKAG